MTRPALIRNIIHILSRHITHQNMCHTNSHVPELIETPIKLRRTTITLITMQTIIMCRRLSLKLSREMKDFILNISLN